MTSAIVSFAVILVFILIWVFLIFKITLFRYFRLKQNQNDAEKGKPVTGTILESVKTGRGKFQAIKLKVEFPNFSNTLVTEEFRFFDSRPEEMRYEINNRVMLLIDYDAPRGPVVRLAGEKKVIGNSFILISIILLGSLFYGLYFLYTASDQALHSNWHDLNPLFDNNESMPMMGIIFLATLLFQFGVFRLIGRLAGSGKKTDDKELKYYGEKTMATILKYEDTGVSVNDNPKVKFHYSFTDKNGQIHHSEESKVIGKLEIGLLPTMKEKEIIYLPQNPAQSKFTENLNPVSFAGCLNVVLVFETLIFTVITLAIYLASLPA